MSSVIDHYAKHLGPIYGWMAGGIEPAIARGLAELDAINLPAAAGALTVDLGAGFGMHAIPLARRGYSVLALDSCAPLLDELRDRKGDLPIQVVEDDLLAFGRYLSEPPQAIFCMGDTLTHLGSTEAVLKLISEVAAALPTQGHFVVTFRDYSIALTDKERFIPVRSDENRILTCYLEYSDTQLTVHDLLYEREGSRWNLRVSSYQKLRLSPAWLVRNLESRGFVVRQEPGTSGMIRLVAQRG